MLYNYYLSRVFMHKEKGFICEKVYSFDLAIVFDPVYSGRVFIHRAGTNRRRLGCANRFAGQLGSRVY